MSFRRHRWLLVSVYVPTVLFAFGQGLLVPILPLYAAEFGSSYALAGFVVAAGWIGQMVADLPVGMMLKRLGFRRAMMIGAFLFGGATITLGFAVSPLQLIVLQLIAGVGIAFFQISRHAFLSQVVAVEMRGRTIAVFGGINRIGHFVGPLIGGYVALYYGLSSAVILAGVVALSVFVVAFLMVREPHAAADDPKRRTFDPSILREVIAHRPRELAAGGAAQVFGQMIRGGRQIVIPLYGAYVVGLDPAQVGQVVAASSLIDIFLFIPAGIIMDRWGRKAAAVPSFALMGVGMAMIPLTSSFQGLLLVGLLIGFGNGIGSGTLMTLGADLAPPGRTGEFLGLWRLIGDSGHAVAPLAIGAVADVIGLALTSGIVGGIGFISAGTLARFVRETRWDTVERSEVQSRELNQRSEASSDRAG